MKVTSKEIISTLKSATLGENVLFFMMLLSKQIKCEELRVLFVKPIRNYYARAGEYVSGKTICWSLIFIISKKLPNTFLGKFHDFFENFNTQLRL